MWSCVVEMCMFTKVSPSYSLRCTYMYVPVELVYVRVCARVSGQGKARQHHNSRENGGGDCESPTYSLAYTVGNLCFVVL